MGFRLLKRFVECLILFSSLVFQEHSELIFLVKSEVKRWKFVPNFELFKNEKRWNLMDSSGNRPMDNGMLWAGGRFVRYAVC